MSQLPSIRSCGCTDFGRSELLRRGVAQAGKGLPSIQPGMPTPAGTGLSRRVRDDGWLAAQRLRRAVLAPLGIA